MTEKEKELVERIAALPAPLQDKFLERLQGAEMALAIIQAPAPPEGARPCAS